MMKKFLSLTAAVLLLGALGFTSGQKESVDVSSSKNGKPTEVLFWSSMSGGMGKTLDQIVSDYNASQEKVHVTVAFQGNYYDMASKLQIAVTSGDTPNMAQLEMGRTKMFADYDILVDMTELAKNAGLDTKMFLPGLMSCSDWGKGIYAIPFNRSTPMFYYNKNMFKEVGLDPEKPPRNWKELRDYARKLSIANKRWGYEMPIDAWFYEAFIMQSGGNILNADETDVAFNNATGIEPLKLWKTMIQEGSMKAPPGKEYNSYEAARSDFAAGISGMIVSSSGDLATLLKSCTFDVGTCFLPANTRYGVPTGGANVVMLAGHEKEEAATMDFIKYLSSPEIAAYWSSNTGYVPSSDAAFKTKTYQDYLTRIPAGKTAYQQMKYTDIPRPVNVHYPEIHAEIMMTEIQRCMQESNYTPEQATAAISLQARALLAKNKK